MVRGEVAPRLATQRPQAVNLPEARQKRILRRENHHKEEPSLAAKSKGKIRHIAISVPDSWAAAEFYKEAFGLE
jgi:catechol-2,3-dioxygenase